ncbi:hypothetical protein A9Q83_06765 [Alphaproteobacteria bacterium 46_93_T64]|nr:hypothetical protein A9Q83_06765 [Alphaproteobacteria bacterium 46_93_T64]
MAKSGQETVNLKALVAEQLNGKRGFANSKKLKRMGIEAYSQWLEEKIATKIASKSAKSGKK